MGVSFFDDGRHIKCFNDVRTYKVGEAVGIKMTASIIESGARHEGQ
jgi:hypothetical protein